MTDIVEKLRETARTLQAEVERGLEEKRREFRYRLEQRKVVFEREMLAQHRALRIRFLHFLRESKIATVATVPVIYSLALPLALLDVMVTLYQHVCFRVYGIPRVRRAEHVIMDRKYLAYLNWAEKLNCIYCEYANGVISYAREVASRTEQYWCPIKHARKVKSPHDRYYDFFEYGDAGAFREKLDEQRGRCRACEAKGKDGSEKE